MRFLPLHISHNLVNCDKKSFTVHAPVTTTIFSSLTRFLKQEPKTEIKTVLIEAKWSTASRIALREWFH